jgi:hypothetical protein
VHAKPHVPQLAVLVARLTQFPEQSVESLPQPDASTEDIPESKPEPLPESTVEPAPESTPAPESDPVVVDASAPASPFDDPIPFDNADVGEEQPTYNHAHARMAAVVMAEPRPGDERMD